LAKRPYQFVAETGSLHALSKPPSQSIASKWFRASEDAGDFMGIRYGRVAEGSGEVEWHFVSHCDCDGIGGFARLLRERGVETGKLPETKHPRRGVIAPVWRLWRDSRRAGECAGRGDWSASDQPAAGVSGAVAWHLFTEDETREIGARCRRMNVTVNSFLLKHLDQAVRPGIRRPEAVIPWMIPVNLRGDIRHSDDTENHVSCVEARIALDDSPESIQQQILRRLARGEHRANHLLLMAGGILSHSAKVAYLKNDRAKPAGNIGAFSNLGVWDAEGENTDGWVFCPPVVTGQLLGAGCVTYRGRLGLAIQGHPALSSIPDVAAGWMSRWLVLIRNAG
jgi:hypothetical protein